MSQNKTEKFDPIIDGEDRFKSAVQIVVYSLAVATVAYHIYYSLRTPMDRTQHANIHLGLLLAVFYLSTLDFDAVGRKGKMFNWASLGLLALTILGSIYVHLNFDRWLHEASALLVYSQVDLLIGLAMICIVTHATWRAYGKLLAAVILASLSYGLIGPSLPGLFYHSGMTPEQLIFMNSITLNGVYGFLLEIGSTWVVIFILFAGLVQSYGGMQYIMKMGTKISGAAQSGIAQVAIVASMAMGSITGSSAANVATTGSFTIPLMTDNGIRGKIAGAIESVASTGGQMLPPVMGSAAFIMADILGVSYFEVIRGAFLPAMLFYLGIICVVHLEALKHNWGTTQVTASDIDTPATTTASSTSSRHSVIDDLIEGIPYIVPVGILIYLLVVLRYDPMTAGTYAILSLLGTSLIRDVMIGGYSAADLRSAVSQWARATIEGCKIGVINMAPLTAVLASLGIIVRVLTESGFTHRFSLQMVALGGGIFALVLVLAMVASILFGLGMPTPAAYVVVATLTAPGLVQLGVGELTAHMFVFYFALLSTITPPVALSCAVASGISGSDFMETCIETIRLGFFAFIIPFVFILNESLIYWNGAETWLTLASVGIGMIGLAMAITGHNGTQSLSVLRRSGYLGTSLVILLVLSGSTQAIVAGILLAWLTAVNLSGADLPGKFLIRR